MSTRRNKLPAFTLVEMMIVLLLSSMLMTAGSILYQNVTSYHMRLRDRTEITNTFQRLKYYLLRDSGRSEDVDIISNALHLNNGQIKYYFEADTVFRVFGLHEDAFLIKAQCVSDPNGILINFDLYEQMIPLSLKTRTSARQVWNSNQ